MARIELMGNPKVKIWIDTDTHTGQIEIKEGEQCQVIKVKTPVLLLLRMELNTFCNKLLKGDL